MPVPVFTIKLIIGLGNPGKEYDKTRHNLGFYVLDYYVQRKGEAWAKDEKCNGLVTEVKINDKKVFCLKPQTFMNLSGESVQKFCSYHKISTNEVMVVCDDISIPFGNFKVSTIPGTAGHNGIKNITKMAGNGFVRYRIGLGPKPSLMPLDHFVLSRFSEEEQKQLPQIANVFENNIEVLIDKGVIKGLNFIER